MFANRFAFILAPITLLGVAAAQAPGTRAGLYRNVTVIGTERYVVKECRAAAPIDAASVEGGCRPTRSRIAGGTIDVALACPAGRSKTITGTYTPDSFTIRTLARGYGPGPSTSQVTSTRIGDCTPED